VAPLSLIEWVITTSVPVVGAAGAAAGATAPDKLGANVVENVGHIGPMSRDKELSGSVFSGIEL